MIIRTIQSEGVYVNGERNGKWKLLKENGEIFIEYGSGEY